MFRKSKLYTSIIAATSASFGAGYANAATLEEIVVTATKTSQSAQDVAVSLQAVGAETIDELGIETFDEYVKYLPNVVNQGRGPGQSEIYIRGVATEQAGNVISSVNGTSPTVALYLDEQPVAFGGRNLDIYAADLERVEVLPGPQGTLFGASSQAGTVRLITNKPQQGEFSGGAKASHAWTDGGEQSTASQAYINVPLTEKLAVRAVFYNDNQGGWIDNVAGSFNSNDQELIQVINRNQISGAASVATTANIERASNENLIEENFNDASYKGARIGVAYEFNDNWDILVQHTSQTLETEGAFEYEPFLDNHGEESVAKFAPQENEDSFELTTWTLSGRVGTLDLIYTGGFLDREVSSIIDYTDYTYGGGYQVYYVCSGGYTDATDCFSPEKQYLGNTNNERHTHEFRVTTDQDQRLRFTGGVYYDRTETDSVGEFQYFGALDAGFDVASASGTVIRRDASGDPILDSDGKVIFEPLSGVSDIFGHGRSSVFVNDFSRTEEQIAVFGELSFDIVSDFLTVTIGVRDYDIDFKFNGATGSSFGCKGVDLTGLSDGDFIDNFGSGAVARVRPDGTIGCDATQFDNRVTDRLRALGDGSLAALNSFYGEGTVDPDIAVNNGADIAADIANGSLNVDGLDSNGTLNESNTIGKFTIDLKPSDDILVFATYSEGFRPPVMNRNAGRAAGNQTGPFQNYRVPAIATTDELENYELGIKSDLLDGSLRLNATYFFSEISGLQSFRFDPTNVAFLTFAENVGDAEVQGLDADLQWAATDNLTLFAAASFVDSEITRLNDQLVGVAVPEGSELPYTPEFSFNIRGRYDFTLPNFGAEAFVQLGLVYTGESKAGLVGNAYFVEDTTQRIYGHGSGLEIEDEGGSFGSEGVVDETQAAVAAVGIDGINPDFLTSDGELFKSGRYVQKDYTLVNFSTGVSKDNWSAELYIDNLFDERAQVYISSQDFSPVVSTNRPRTVGLRFAFEFE